MFFLRSGCCARITLFSSVCVGMTGDETIIKSAEKECVVLGCVMRKERGEKREGKRRIKRGKRSFDAKGKALLLGIGP
ncbi:hypothetical protein [Candidatus Bartonella washoeensis]|uniref:hypothetical protein n=1 Tax=Candidatus Bartonella washoeensis TaxID=186739 RepID=UPI0002D3CB5C|nr:hypothetical protein [Bartonella washoeensis]